MIKKVKNARIIIFNIFLALSALILTCGAIVTGAYVQEGYQLQVGDISTVRLKAPRRIENRIATERNKAAAENAAAEMKPLLKKDETINDKTRARLESFFELASELRKEYTPIYIPYADTSAETIDDETVHSPAETKKYNLPITLDDSQIEYLLSMETDLYIRLHDHVYEIMENTLKQGVQEVDAKTLLFVRSEFDKLDSNEEFKVLGYEITASYLIPNYVVDEAATQNARNERAADYDIVYVLKDELIVDADVRISEEAYDILDSLGLVSKSLSEMVMPIVGSIIIAIIVFVLCMVYMNSFHKNTFINKRESIMLMTIYMVAILLSWLLKDLPYQVLPILFFTMLVSMLIDLRLAIALNSGATLICLLICNGDMEFFIFYIVAGFFISIVSKFTVDRNNTLPAGLLMSLFNFILSLGISLFFEKGMSAELINSASFAAANGIISVILCMGSLPIWEGLFGVVTPIKLLDLTNPNKTLLRRLTIEAPGTYHHSLIVANLAETAAYDIGANPNIARVGGYYHDIGKLKYPHYFSENQLGDNPHDNMDPYSSVQVIISHVTYGLELADEHRLPKLVKDMIGQHHGTTMVKYFYHKFMKENPEADVDENDFRYSYGVPQTKESAIVMLADTVEAAVRSMIPSGKSLEEVEKFVQKLLKDKLDDGQLIDSMLTMRDMDTVAKSFMRVFKGMYHERIPYPTVLLKKAERAPEDKSVVEGIGKKELKTE